jgi:hypothetical protein
MNNILNLVIRIHDLFLRLYPKAFRSEFEGQMQLDFADLANDASRKGKLSIVLFGLRELIDFPVNLLEIHLKEGSAFKVIHSIPVNHALRGALGYGMVFALAIPISEFVSLKLFIEDNSLVGNLQVLYFDLFHTEHGLELISWIPHAVASLLSGLVLGIFFAVLFVDRSKYGRYILAGMLGWFLHDAVATLLWFSADLVFFLGGRQVIYLNRTEAVLSGTFLAFAFIAAKSEKRELMRLLVGGSFAYPLIAYFYVQFLFKLSVIETPWMFIALMVLILTYIASICVYALKSGVERKSIWMIAAGALGFPLMPYAGHIIVEWVSLLIPVPVIPPSGIPSGSAAAWRLFFRMALDNSIYGMIFGLLMGSMVGLQKNNDSPQLTA